MNANDLKAFEAEVAAKFNAGLIRAPIHLYSGAEEQMLRVFERIDVEKDWVCCTWRNHYQALLKGVPRDLLMQEIVRGKSMVLNLPEYRVISSSIVGGIQSIATGIALAIKIKSSREKVWCWSGDMSSLTGAWSEAYRYAVAHDLPITFIVEDNSKSVLTPTQEVWGPEKWYLKGNLSLDWHEEEKLIYYKYDNTAYPHAGAGKRVQF